ncbi:hypothetical protein UFOVP9_14 [uncultured Caudovirales phage]|jgi:hypothetical protein|uniref:Uncharacterized protein n=1 Tax=uncultured Caudovirales phage TaxID=2100421 RepID=A0A6J5KGN9_9CAUD|nr:hypothetical protein UFOVP9_14 [uncultured Caudovirales phage]
MPNELQVNTGLFVPSTNVWDVDSIRDINVNSKEFKELLIRLYQNINNISVVLNLKDSGLYFQQEFVTGKKLFPNPYTIGADAQGRDIWRMTLNVGALPNATTIAYPHNIGVMTTYMWLDIYGGSTNPIAMTGVPLSNFQISVNATSVSITTTADYSAYTNTLIVLEYVKE